MRALLYDAPGSRPRLLDVARPACPPDGVLIRVAATGVCRSDWHAWMGHDPVPLPMVPGHEFAGTIVTVGEGVSRWHGGERVTVPFACGCGRCRTCERGQTHICPEQTQPGFTHWGSFAEIVAVHAADANVVELPDEIDFVTAASLGCRFATAFRAVTTQGRVRPGDTVLIHGAGGVGLSAVQVGRALDARVTVVDPSPTARARAIELGADRALDLDEFALLRRTEARSVDVVVDAIGAPDLLESSTDVLAPGGRYVQVGLLFGAAARTPTPMGPFIGRELELLGSHGMPAHDYPAMLDLITSGRARPQELVGRVIGLDEASEALIGLDESPMTGMTVVTIG